MARIFFKRKETFLAELSAFGSDRSNFSFATSTSMYCENKHTCWAGGNFFVVNIATEKKMGIDRIYKGLRRFSLGSINRGEKVTSILLIKLYVRSFNNICKCKCVNV